MENVLHKNDCQLLFKLRSMMLDVKSNFSGYYENDMSCRTCKIKEMIENEQHLLECKMFKEEIKSNVIVKYEFVFGDLDHQKIALSAFKSVLRKREVLLKLQENHGTSPS